MNITKAVTAPKIADEEGKKILLFRMFLESFQEVEKEIGQSRLLPKKM